MFSRRLDLVALEGMCQRQKTYKLDVREIVPLGSCFVPVSCLLLRVYRGPVIPTAIKRQSAPQKAPHILLLLLNKSLTLLANVHPLLKVRFNDRLLEDIEFDILVAVEHYLPHSTETFSASAYLTGARTFPTLVHKDAPQLRAFIRRQLFSKTHRFVDSGRRELITPYSMEDYFLWEQCAGIVGGWQDDRDGELLADVDCPKAVDHVWEFIRLPPWNGLVVFEHVWEAGGKPFDSVVADDVDHVLARQAKQLRMAQKCVRESGFDRSIIV